MSAVEMLKSRRRSVVAWREQVMAEIARLTESIETNRAKLAEYQADIDDIDQVLAFIDKGHVAPIHPSQVTITSDSPLTISTNTTTNSQEGTP